MKKLLLFGIALFGGMQMFGQVAYPESYQNVQERPHEVRLGAIKLLAGGIFEGGYEYILKSNQGFGVNILTNLNGKTTEEDYFEDYAFNPYYRFYFNKSQEYGAKGFFAEGFVNVYSGRNFFDKEYFYSDYIEVSENEHKRFFETALGLAIGQKWVNTSGFVIELKAGIGRNLLGNSDATAIFKGDLSIGYRFK